MCSAAPEAALAAATLQRFVAIKTHGTSCNTATRLAGAYSATDVSASAAQPAVASMMGVVLPGALAIGLAVCGMVVLVQHYYKRQSHAAPLLSDY